MNLPDIDVLIDSLLNPIKLTTLNPAQWDLLIRQGRSADLLARIGAAAYERGCLDAIPAQARMHIESALNLATRQQRELRTEVHHIAKALVPTGIPLVLLKGAAYAMANLGAARGRLVSDVDILVPHAALQAVETALMMEGWVSTAKSDYDQRYYRTWMHELPPMHHMQRGTVIDVHHAILPVTSKLRPSSEELLATARPVSVGSSIYVLAPIDMILHSATHLFHEGELEKGLHGLFDIDALLKEFAVVPGFWLDLISRAQVLNLVRPLYYALRYASALLGSPVPPSVLVSAQQIKGAQGGVASLWLMDALFLRALRPAHASASDAWTPMARTLLYVRGHWLRMPPWLLTRHLLRKFLTPAPAILEK